MTSFCEKIRVVLWVRKANYMVITISRTFPIKDAGSWPNAKYNDWVGSLDKSCEGKSNFGKYGKTTNFMENKSLFKMKSGSSCYMHYVVIPFYHFKRVFAFCSLTEKNELNTLFFLLYSFTDCWASKRSCKTDSLLLPEQSTKQQCGSRSHQATR